MDALYSWSDVTKLGVALTGFGIFFTCCGVLMFLDSSMLTLGNILFVAGVALVMGPQRCRSFFFDPKRRRASICYFLGISLVMMGWCFFGIILQGFGTLNLFGNFFPMVARVLEAMPVVGAFMRLSVVQTIMMQLDVGRRRSV
jgi:hypothetical protein